MVEKIPNKVLRLCALDIMENSDLPIKEVPSPGRSMIYKLSSGETVRLRTSNDPVLVVAVEPSDVGPKLNIEGTDKLLLVMPEQPLNRWENIVGYLMPTSEVIAAIKSSYPKFFDRQTNRLKTKQALTLSFEDSGKPSGGFEGKWERYLLPMKCPARAFQDEVKPVQKVKKVSSPRQRPKGQPETVNDVIAEARERISEITKVPIKSVKVSVSLGD